MVWDEIIERNVERLAAVLTELLVMAGFGRGDTAFLPRSVCRALLVVLRPAEFAARRLIAMAARRIVLKLRDSGASRAFPAELVLKRDAERVAAFRRIVVLKRFAAEGIEWGKAEEQVLPRISVPGFIDPVFASAKPMTGGGRSDLPAAIRRRLQALRYALDDLERKAKRPAGAAGREKIGRLSLFRSGFAPAFRRHEPRGIDAIPGDRHYFAREALEKPDTS